MRGSGPGFSEIMEFRTPPIDIQETENEIIVKADIPGFEKGPGYCNWYYQ